MSSDELSRRLNDPRDSMRVWSPQEIRDYIAAHSPTTKLRMY